MPKDNARAPRNRTLTLTPAERKQYAKSLMRFEPGAAYLDRIFNDDLLAHLDQLPKNSVDLLFLDPPYNLTKDYGQVKFQKQKEIDYEQWFRSWFCRLVPVLKSDATVYICGDWRTSVSIYKVLSEVLHIRNRITWEREKGRGSLQNWKNCSEDIWYATVSKDKFQFHVEAVKLKRRVMAPYKTDDGTPKDWQKSDQGNFRMTYPSNLWTDISIPFWSMPENTDHPTQKPEKLLAKLILASSSPGDVIFDPFMGSGTTAVVAAKLGRRYFGFEINPEYCLWAYKRLAQTNTQRSIQGYAEGVFWERNST